MLSNLGSRLEGQLIQSKNSDTTLLLNTIEYRKEDSLKKGELVPDCIVGCLSFILEFCFHTTIRFRAQGSPLHEDMEPKPSIEGKTRGNIKFVSAKNNHLPQSMAGGFPAPGIFKSAALNVTYKN